MGIHTSDCQQHPLIGSRSNGTRVGIAVLLSCFTLALVGCNRPALTPLSFSGVTTNTTFGQLVKGVGRPNRGYPSFSNMVMVGTYEWDLSNPTTNDHYVMVLKIFGPPEQSTNRVLDIQLTNRPAFIDFSTNHSTAP